MKHPVAWQTPSPLWQLALKDAQPTRLNRPEILRFDGDTFMEDLQATLDTEAADLQKLVVRSETAKDPDVGWRSLFDPDQTIRLFQPAHQRFYLVAASLVCRARGFPDRKVDGTKQEAVSFVIRRRFPDASGNPREYGWFGVSGWKRIQVPDTVDRRSPADDTVIETEERIGMFPALVTSSRNPRRRLWVGFIPVGNREQYENGPREDPAAPIGAEPIDPKLSDGYRRVELLLDAAEAALDVPAGDLNPDQIREVLEFALFELAELFKTQLNEDQVEKVISSSAGKALETILRHSIQKEFWESIYGVRGAASKPHSLFEHLKIKEDFEDAIAKLRGVLKRLDLPSPPPPTLSDTSDGSTYVIRCVHDRPRCEPFEKPVVSPPSQRVTFASFYDPDAPRWPTRISMPDTSLSSLAKAVKSVKIATSKQLNDQMAQVDQIPALGGAFEPISGGGFAMICSLSIPIITVCATILLMIVVNILNIVFFWVPFFKICLPLPAQEEE